MPTVKLAPPPRQQFEDSNGSPYVGAKLFTYSAGSTTKIATYTDSTGLTANTNPIILDSAGRTPYGVWLTAGLNYKFVLALSTDTDPPSSPIFTEDVVSGVNDTATTTSQWIASGVTPTYISATQFTLVGDKTADFHVGRRLKFTVTAGTVYGLITVSAYTTLTTVTVIMDSGALDTGLSAVELSILLVTGHALPKLTSANLTAVGIQPVDATLTAYAGTLTAANKIPYATALDTAGELTRSIDGTLAGNSDLNIPTEKAVKTYADGLRKILQVVHFDTGAGTSGTTILPFDDTIPQNTEGDLYMSLAITPISATSTLRIDVSLVLSPSVSSAVTAALFRDTGANALGATVRYIVGGEYNNYTFSVKATSGSVAATTFNVRAGMGVAGTTTFNGVSGGRFLGGVMASSIRITEISA